MKIDFWQLSRDPVEKVVALIAQRLMDGGERLLVVSGDPEQREAISRGLWKSGPEHFLANGEASDPGAELQPILLAGTLDRANGASHVVFADGAFRDPAGFERAFLLFDEDTKQAARRTWSELDSVDGLERSYFEQVDGRWVKKR